jgi:hypothetical protein
MLSLLGLVNKKSKSSVDSVEKGNFAIDNSLMLKSCEESDGNSIDASPRTSK